MGYINQTASVANSSKMTISMWCQIPDISGLTTVPLLEFGQRSNDNLNQNSGIYLVYSGAVPNYAGGGGAPCLYTVFNAVGNSLDLGANVSGSTTTNTEWKPETTISPGPPPVTNPEGHFHWIIGAGSEFFQYIDATVPFVNTYVPAGFADAGKWFHLLIAVDVSADNTTTTSAYGDTGVVTGSNKLSIFVNGQDVGFSYTGGGIFDGLNSDQSQSFVYPNATALAGRPPGEWPMRAYEFRNTDSSSPVSMTVPGWQIAISSFAFGLPSPSSFPLASSHPSVRYADVQIWVNQYISPTTHIASFIDTGAPVNPADASAAFGTPDFLFRGNASGFPVNQGTAGSLSQTGTITDVTPGP